MKALAEKTIHWESYPEKTNPTTFRIGMHYIESSITAEVKNHTTDEIRTI